MGGDGYAVLLQCPRCDALYDEGDNFCRRCGAGLDARNLPVARDSYDVVPWQGAVPALVRGAAVVAAGTLAELLLRRLVGRMLRPARSLVRAKNARVAEAPVAAPEDESHRDDAHLVSETLLLRRVRLRR